MRLAKPHSQIYLFLGDSPADLGKPFVRLQEYFESPSKLFRRRLFTLKKFKDWYCKHQSSTGRFTYYQDYGGYNVPGHVVNSFFCLYADRLSLEEIGLLKMIDNAPLPFYVIGAPADSASTVDHELSHAFWYLFPEYRKSITSMFDGYDLSSVKRYLKRSMYSEDMMQDELAAYTMFDSKLLNGSGVKTAHLSGLRGGMLGVYQAYKSKYIKL